MTERRIDLTTKPPEQGHDTLKAWKALTLKLSYRQMAEISERMAQDLNARDGINAGDVAEALLKVADEVKS